VTLEVSLGSRLPAQSCMDDPILLIAGTRRKGRLGICLTTVPTNLSGPMARDEGGALPTARITMAQFIAHRMCAEQEERENKEPERALVPCWFCNWLERV
jgi:hypothetical protein